MESETMPAALQIRDLRKRYGAVQALDGVSFAVEAGEIVGLLGPNGAGKTTAVESIAGLCEPDGGAIEVRGVDARRNPGEAKQTMGFALAATALPDKITPREAIDSFGAFYRRRVSTGDLITRFDLEAVADRFFETLSTGQRQRLALALAVVNQPEILILDEPSAGLDLEARRNLQAAIERLKKEGGAVLLTTHDMVEAQRLCDRVVVIHRGRIVTQGSPSALKAGLTRATTVSLQLGSELRAGQVAGIGGIRDVQCAGPQVRFVAEDVNQALAQLLPVLHANGVEILELHAQKATLEDVVAGFM
jgi:ABC-2 type transport system ATP-binding protein